MIFANLPHLRKTIGKRRRSPYLIPLRLALIVPFVLLIVGTVGLISQLYLLDSRQAVQEFASQLMVEVGDRVSLYLNDYLETPQLINRLNANAVDLGEIDLTNQKILERHFLQQLKTFSSTSRIHFSNPQGGYIATGNDERGLTVAATDDFVPGTLRVYQISKPEQPSLLLEQPNYDARQRPFYQQAITVGQPTWTPIYVYLPDSRGLGISASYPLYDRTQQLQGVLASDLTLKAIHQFLDRLSIGRGGDVFIMERSGLLVAASTAEPPCFKNASDQMERRKAIDSQEPLIRLSTQYLISHFGDLSHISSPTQLNFDRQGEQQFLSVMPFQDQFGLDWLIVVTVPAADFMGDMSDNTHTTLLLSLGALVGSIALGLWLSQAIVRPIRRLGQASLAVAAGNWNGVMPQGSLITELQVLSTSFHQMANQLQESFDRVKAALQESEEKFTKVFRTCPDAISIVTLDGRYMEVNDAFVDLFGYGREDVIGRTEAEIGHWVHPEERQQYVQRVQAGELVRNREFNCYNRTGKRLTVLFSADCIELEGQLCIVGVAKDVSDRQQSQLELLQQKELRETIYNESTDALFLVNVDTLKITDCNRRAVELFEAKSKANLIGIEGRVLQHHPFTSEEMDQIIAEMQQHGFWSRELEYITLQGNLFWGNLAAKSVAIADQTMHLVRVTDITDRKRTEKDLQQSEARFQKIATASPAQIYILVYTPQRNEMRFEYISSGVQEIQELEPEQVMANPLLTYNQVHPDDRPAYIQATTHSLTTLEPFFYEWRIITPSGKVKWVRANSRPERRDNGEIAWYGVLLDVTDRKLAEEALRQSEAALRRAQQVAHVGSWEVDVATQTVIWSEESFRIFGWDLAQPEPDLSQFYDLVHPGDRTRVRHAVNQCITSKNSYRIEFCIVQPNGSLRYVESRGDAVVNEQGQVVQLLGTNLDITERRQVEEALRQSEATKNQILKAIPDLLIWMTADGTYLDLIEGNECSNLYPRAMAVSRNLYDLLPFNLAQLRMNATQQALKTGEVQIYEQEIVDQETTHYEEVRVVSVGQNRVLVIIRDITHRKQAEAAQRDSEERFRRAFHDAPIGMALIGLDDRWLKVNPMLCDMLGYSETELLSLKASALVHPDDLNQLWHCLEQVQSNETRNAQVELRYYCQPGQVAWGVVSLSLVRDAQGQRLYYVAQIQDITERQAIDRMKNEFISIVSHELRTPLTAIRGFLGLLNTGIYDNKPDKAKNMLQQALSNSDRLVRLVNDILDLERLSSGRVQFTLEVCQAEDLVRRAVAEVQSLADQAHITLAMQATPAQVWAAPDAIIQTLTNLLSNAIKFSPAYSTITLSVQPQTRSVLFAVQDQGRGIPVDKLETIFERFQQVDVSDSRQKGGTGLGLAICQSIIQQHGGNIWAESNLGQGSTFYFTLLLPPGEEP